MKENISTSILVILLVLLSVLSYLLGSMNLIEFNKALTPLSNIESNDCNNSILSKSAECLNKEVRTFFIYNKSNYKKDINITQLKTEGGTCVHWTNYYLDNLESFGFMGKEIDFWDEGDKKGHAIALVWNKDLSSYCLLDQVHLIGCIDLGGNNEN